MALPAVNKLTDGFGKLQTAIVGALGAWTGEKMLASLTSIVEKTADLSHALTQVQKLGNDINVGDISGRAAGITTQVRGITQKDVVDIFKESFSILGEKDAKELLSPLSKWAVVQGNSLGEYDHPTEQIRDAVRAGEQMGKLTGVTGEVDTAKLKEWLDFMTRITTATGGQVNAHTMYQMSQTGGAALSGMNYENLGLMAILSQVMGGPRAGTGAMSLFQQMAGGTMFKRNAQELQELGMLKEDEWSTDKGGRVILSAEAKERLGKMATDLKHLVLGGLTDAMVAHGYDSPDAQVRELFSLLPRQTTQRLLSDIIRNRGQVVRELERMEKGLGTDASYDAANQNDVQQNLVNLTAAYKNFWYAVAGPNSENTIAVLKSLTGAIEGPSWNGWRSILKAAFSADERGGACVFRRGCGRPSATYEASPRTVDYWW